jgi:hypothetical protein
VATTKEKFLQLYKTPISSVYNTVIQELLVQQHFMRHSIHYQYNAVFALGVMSVLDQILESLPSEERAAIIDAYVSESKHWSFTLVYPLSLSTF